MYKTRLNNTIMIPKWLTVLLVLSSVTFCRSNPYLELIDQNGNINYNHVIEATIGSNISLSCVLRESKSPDYNLVWARRSKNLWFKNEADLKKLAKDGSKNITDLQKLTGQSSLNEAKIVFHPVKFEDRGAHFCMSLKNMLFKIVRLKVKEKKQEVKLVCSIYQFRCRSGDCISIVSKCDGRMDCPDHSDEDDCVKPDPCPGQIDCEDAGCISTSWCCDKNTDGNCNTIVRPSCCPPLIYDVNNADVTNNYNNQNQPKSNNNFLYYMVTPVVFLLLGILFVYFCSIYVIKHIRRNPNATTNGPIQIPMPTIVPAENNEGNTIFASLITPANGNGDGDNISIDYLDLPPSYANSIRNSAQNSLHSSINSLPSYAEALAMTPSGSRRSSSDGDSRPATPDGTRVASQNAAGAAARPAT